MRRVVLMIAMTVAIVAAAVVFNFAANPYGAWPPRLLDAQYREVKAERLATPYLLRSAHPQTVLLGSSRVLMGMRIEQGERDGVMNAALSAATVSQIAREMDVVLDNPGLKRIVWALDFFAFDKGGWSRRDSSLDLRLSGSREQLVTDTLLSFTAVEDGFAMARRAIAGPSQLSLDARVPVPWPMTLICERLNHLDSRGLRFTTPQEIQGELSRDLPDYTPYQFSADSFELFRKSVDAARARGVTVILFVPPMSRYELELIRQAGRWDTFQDWKRQLAGVGTFTDFSGYNEMSGHDEFFMHVMHFKTVIGNLILRILFGDPIEDCSPQVPIVREAAVRVDEAKVERVLAAEDRAMRAATASESPYSRLAAATLAHRARDRAANEFAN